MTPESATTYDHPTGETCAVVPLAALRVAIDFVRLGLDLGRKFSRCNRFSVEETFRFVDRVSQVVNGRLPGFVRS